MTIQIVNPTYKIHSFKKGIQLLPPERSPKNFNKERFTVKELFDSPSNTYFVNLDGTLNSINTECAKLCGFLSENDAIGKTAFDFLKPEAAHFARITDNLVLKNQSLDIFEQQAASLDNNTLFQYLTIKLPVYNAEDHMIGLLGCSIAMGIHSISEALKHLLKYGILVSSNMQFNSGHKSTSNGEIIPLSKQQKMCAKLLLDGLTIKNIGLKLALSSRTVETYVNNMKLKLNCMNKTELILKLQEIYKASNLFN